MKKSVLIYGLTILLWVVSARAVTVTQLYTASLPVSQRVLQPSLMVEAQLLNEVLVRVSGNSKVSDQDVIAAALKAPQQYVQQYFYSRNNKQLLLSIHFDPMAVKQLLSQAGQAVWGNNRPLMLVWLVSKTPANQPQIMSATSNDPLLSLFEKIGTQRGVPIVFPIQDITDMQAISIAQILSGDDKAISAASARYMPDVILTVTVDATDQDVITSHWQLSVNGQTYSWNVLGPDQATITKLGLDDVIDRLAQEYSIVEGGSQSQVQIQINGLNDARDYAGMLHYLSRLNGVSDVNIVSISGDQASFMLNVRGGATALAKQIALGHILIKPAGTEASAGQQNLIYIKRN